MKTLLIIVCIILGTGVLAFVGTLVYFIVSIATGRITTKELNDMVAKEKERKAAKKTKKSSSSAHWLNYPSPLNNWGLWH